MILPNDESDNSNGLCTVLLSLQSLNNPEGMKANGRDLSFAKARFAKGANKNDHIICEMDLTMYILRSYSRMTVNAVCVWMRECVRAFADSPVQQQSATITANALNAVILTTWHGITWKSLRWIRWPFVFKRVFSEKSERTGNTHMATNKP